MPTNDAGKKYEKRIQRLMRIVTLVQAESGWTAERLAEETGVAVRTLFRDIRDLRAAGVPIDLDDEAIDPGQRGYRMTRGFLMPPVQLSLDESLALITLAQRIAESEQIPLTRAASTAVTKIRSQLPPKVGDMLRELDDHIAVRLAQTGPHDGIEDVSQRIREAITERRALLCRYEGVHDKDEKHTSEFVFKPYTLLFCKRAWYAIGLHEGHGEIRTLKLVRFTSVKPTDKPYGIPDDFSLASHLGDAWTLVRGRPSHDVEIHFDPAFAENIADTQWHHTQEIEWQEDDSLIFRCRVDGLDEIVWWVMSMGPNCRVLKPKVLANRVAELAADVVGRYE